MYRINTCQTTSTIILHSYSDSNFAKTIHNNCSCAKSFAAALVLILATILSNAALFLTKLYLNMTKKNRILETTRINHV